MDITKIEIMGKAIKAGEEMVSLTDLWKAAKGTNNQKPTFWLRQEEVIKLKESLAKTVKLTDNQLAYSKRGGTDSGTFAHWQLALAYAKYLSPELHLAVNDIYRRFQEADPALAANIIQRTDGKSAALLAKEAVKRVDDSQDLALIEIIARRKRANNELRSELANHAPSQFTYAAVADQNNIATVGLKAKDIRKSLNLRSGDQTRDSFHPDKMLEIAFREHLQMLKLQSCPEIQGHKPIVNTVKSVNHDVTALIHQCSSRSIPQYA